MTVLENYKLAPHTSFHLGGIARFYIHAESEHDLDEAIVFAREKKLPLIVLGFGTNVLIPDTVLDAVVLHVARTDIRITGTEIVAGAGAAWDEVVDAATAAHLSGIENLAGIPGSTGGAVVQNIGAYGAELSETFLYADTVDAVTGARERVTRHGAQFGYRTSMFKQERNRIITSVALTLTENGTPRLTYADLAAHAAAGVPLTTPREVAAAVRAIRAKKFPNAVGEGTAGSFFKNPVITRELFETLSARYAGLPGYPQADGSVKVSLAWLLDHALNLKGYVLGNVRLYEKQPIVMVARDGANASEVDAFASLIATRVYTELGITIEREVETFAVKK